MQDGESKCKGTEKWKLALPIIQYIYIHVFMKMQYPIINAFKKNIITKYNKM